MAETNAPITDPNELAQFAHAPFEKLPAGTGGAMRDLLPLSTQALNLTGPSQTEKLVQEELRPGIPMQVNPPEESFGEGVLGNVNPWLRLQTARRKSIEDQQAYLESKFPGKVRKAKNSDDFIIEMTDPKTGKPRDVLLNEEQVTLGDVAALLGQAPEIGLSLLSMAGAGKIAALMKAPKAIAGGLKLLGAAAGFKGGEAAEQISTRLEQGQPAKAGEVLAEKAKELPGQAALEFGTAGIFKTASLLKRVAQGGPGMFQTAAQTEGLPAEAALKAKTGQGIRYSAAQASGMPLFAFGEAYATAKPQSTPVMQNFFDAQLNDIKAVSEALTSKAGTDEEVGTKLLDFLNANQEVKQKALDKVRATMTKAESDALTKQLGKVAPVGKFEPSAMGAQFRSEVQAAHQDVKSRVGQAYTDAYGVPGASMPVVPTKGIADEIDFLSDQFPTVEGTKWMQAYKKSLPEKESYKDIVQRRSDLWQKIEESPADRTTKDYVHGQLSKAMTQTLDDASKNIINPQFRGLIQKANELYKKEELPFYQEGMFDILRKAGVRGAPENIELLDRFNKNTDLYRRLVDVTGKTGKPAEIIKSSVIDGLIGKSGTSAIDPQFVDAKTFIKNLGDMATNPKTREMFNDIFGANAKSLLTQAKVLGAIQGTIPKEEAERLLTSGAGAASKRRLAKVLAEQKQLDTVEAKRLLNAPVEEIQPEKFVNSYTDKLSQTELQNLAKRVENDAPALYQQLQEKQIEQILGKAGAYKTWTRTKLENVIYDPKWEPKYRALLGNRFEDVEQFAKALGPIEKAAEQAEGTGMLVKGQSIGGLADVFKLKAGGRRGGSTVGKIATKAMEEVPGWLGWKFAAKFIVSGGFRDWASKGFPAQGPNLIRNVVLSEPFLSDMASSASSPEVVRNLAMSVRDWGNRVSQPSTPQESAPPLRSRKELEQFLKE